MRIAILGWSSLLWESSPEFDSLHDGWALNGPRLPLEFCRISAAHHSTLIPVLDKRLGTATTVAWCLSHRSAVNDAMTDLRKREQAPGPSILSQVVADALAPTASSTLVTIADWAKAQTLDAVIWSGVESNFTKATGKPFSVSTAVAHLKGLPPIGQKSAHDYITRAPAWLKTPVRTALQGAPWFRALGA